MMDNEDIGEFDKVVECEDARHRRRNMAPSISYTQDTVFDESAIVLV